MTCRVTALNCGTKLTEEIGPQRSEVKDRSFLGPCLHEVFR